MDSGQTFHGVPSLPAAVHMALSRVQKFPWISSSLLKHLDGKKDILMETQETEHRFMMAVRDVVLDKIDGMEIAEKKNQIAAEFNVSMEELEGHIEMATMALKHVMMKAKKVVN